MEDEEHIHHPRGEEEGIKLEIGFKSVELIDLE
jgi:hypothetical protein